MQKAKIQSKNRKWDCVPILKYCDFERGTEPGSASYNREGGGVPFIRVGNIAAQIQKQIYTVSKNIKLCKKDDVLLVLDGSPGVVARGIEGAFSSGIRKVVIKNPDKILKAFILYILQANFVQNTIKEYSTGVTIKHASKSLEYIQIPIPSFSEQQKIVGVLDTVREAVETQEKILKLVKELKKSLMAKLFREGTRGTKLKKTEIGEIPENWKVKKLVDVATLQRGKDLPEHKQKAGEYPIIGSSGIMGHHNEYYCIGPGVVTGRSGSIGGITYTEENYWPHNTGLYVKDFHGNNQKFIYYLFHIIDFKNYATGVSVPTLNRNFIHEKKLPLPSLPEQREIAEILQTVDEKIEIEQKKKALYEELFKTILNKLIMREIKVDNLNLK